jgi:hypothetical protein
MYLSYSGYKTYLGCPLAYWHKYIDKTAAPKPENKISALYGSVVGVLFEKFYNDRIWLRPGSDAVLLALIPNVVSGVMRRETDQGCVYDWKAPKVPYKSLDAVISDVREAVPRGLATIREHRLVGKDAAAEVKLDSVVHGNCLGGRADFILRRVAPHSDLVILDGKGSAWGSAYVSAQQLYWYAMLYEHRHKVLPDRLGFVFWRFEPEKAMKWVPVTKDDLEALSEYVTQAITRISNGRLACDKLPLELPEQERRQAVTEHFPGRFSNDCSFCNFLSICDAASKQESSNAATSIGVEDEDDG